MRTLIFMSALLCASIQPARAEKPEHFPCGFTYVPQYDVMLSWNGHAYRYVPGHGYVVLRASDAGLWDFKRPRGPKDTWKPYWSHWVHGILRVPRNSCDEN